VFKILDGLGFSRTEAIVYTYLAKAGPQRTQDLMHGLRIPKKRLYSELKKLYDKGTVTRNTEHPALISALNFEEVLNQFIRANTEQANVLKETKEELLISWRSIIKEDQ
jgi:sugar-specific transcriptional regulator TrmB